MIRLIILVVMSVASVYAADHDPLVELKAYVARNMTAAAAKMDEWLQFRLEGGMLGQQIRDAKRRRLPTLALENALENVLARAKKAYQELQPLLFTRQKLSRVEFVNVFNEVVEDCRARVAADVIEVANDNGESVELQMVSAALSHDIMQVHNEHFSTGAFNPREFTLTLLGQSDQRSARVSELVRVKLKFTDKNENGWLQSGQAIEVPRLLCHLKHALVFNADAVH